MCDCEIYCNEAEDAVKNEKTTSPLKTADETKCGCCEPILRYIQPEKRQSLKPTKLSQSLIGSSKYKLQDLTTQKHDYVAKSVLRRGLIVPDKNQLFDNAFCESGQNKTIQKLSYQPQYKIIPVVSYKPVDQYDKPTVQMDMNTTQKMSFVPIKMCTSYTPPIARTKSNFTISKSPFEKKTIYSESFVEHDNKKALRSQMKPLHSDHFKEKSTLSIYDTIYKDSYFNYDCVERVKPIYPIENLNQSDARLDSNTCYSMSYPKHINLKKLKLIVPVSELKPARGPLDNATTAKLSYQHPGNNRQRVAFQPTPSYKPESGLMEKETVQKLSFLPPGKFEKIANCCCCCC